MKTFAEFTEELDEIWANRTDTPTKKQDAKWVANWRKRNGLSKKPKDTEKILLSAPKDKLTKEDVDEASVFDWKKNKSEIDWNDKKDEPTVSKDGGMVHKARTTDRNPETGGAKDPLNVGRPKGKYGMYKIDKATRDDPDYKKSLSQKVMAAKKDGFEARTDFKTSLNAAIKKRQEELWAKAK